MECVVDGEKQSIGVAWNPAMRCKLVREKGLVSNFLVSVS